MTSDLVPSAVRRVVLVVLDGLRSDAVPFFDLTHLARLHRRGASTFRAQTVSPSVTACAMASLLTGATPDRHGLRSERFHIPRARGTLHPLPKLLADHSLPTSAFLSRVPLLMGGLAQRIATFAGIGEARFEGRGAFDVLAAASRNLEEQRRGLIIMHWPDADNAGHSRGWMSRDYGAAAQRMDDAIGRLLTMIDLDDPATLLVAMADHGGGGGTLKHHNSMHPLDLTIPLVMAVGSVQPGDLGPSVTLPDVPATVLWALGIPRPESYAGRPLLHAFQALPAAA
jgi:predicted AlkP superfamily pyrophosphatase or phosphodiesterase